MIKQIELDENKVLEVQQTNLEIMKHTEVAVIELENATKLKKFDVEGEEILKKVDHQGKEINRALIWWNKEFMGPVVQAAKELHSMMVARRDAIADPLEEKKNRAALAIGAYRRAHDDDRRQREEIERRRLEKEAEDKRIAEALELEKTGKKEEANELIEAPVYTPPVTFAAPEKTKGVGLRQNWKFKIVDPSKVPEEFWMIDESKIGQHIRAHKEKAVIAGVEIWAEDKASFSMR